MPNNPFDNTNKVNAVIQVRRGYDSERTSLEYNEGELIYSTDSRRLYVGGSVGGQRIVGGSVVGNLTHVVPSISHAHYVEKYDMLYNYTTSRLYSLTGAANSASVNDYCLIFDKNEFVLKSDAKLSGDLDMDFHAIKNLKDAVDDNDATNLGDVKDITNALESKLKNLIDGVVAGTGNFVKKDGDTMSGPLVIDSNGVSTTSLNVLSGLTELQDTVVLGLTAKGKVEISGEELSVKGDTNLNSKQLTNFSAKVINSDLDLVELDANIHNGCVLVCSKEAGTGTEKIQIKISKARLVTGFNCIIIQGGDRQVKVITTETDTTLANTDQKFTSRRKYAQINLCMLDASTLWVTGDLVQ
jgi:hypothetical protein